MSNSKKLAAIFDGLEDAYGTYVVEKKQANGKNVGAAKVYHEPRTTAHWDRHIAGQGEALGIIPINRDNSCKWGAIDIDVYPTDHKVIIEKIKRRKLPLVCCRSKSGGAHLYLFSSEWMAAQDMRETLGQIASVLGYGGTEIFPKQIRLRAGDTGNYLSVPYFNAEEGLRYAFHEDGTAATIEEFFKLHETHVQTPEQILALSLEEETSDLTEGPPCLQFLCNQGFPEGTRNNGLFNLGVYLRKAFPDDWETKILAYNMKYMDPPLPLNEVNIVAKQLARKDYTYKCKDVPIMAHCNMDLCRTRKFGIGGGPSASVANLRKYNSDPPVWFLDVNGLPVELNTDSLTNQMAFQKACVEQINFFPPTASRPIWEGRTNALLTEMLTMEGSIIEVSKDSSVKGQFYDFLEEFCTSIQTANDMEEILLRRPWTNEAEKRTLFRLKDFSGHLRKNRFFEYKANVISQRLRDIGGEPLQIRIKNKPTRVWSIPAFDVVEVEVNTPNFGDQNSPPF